MANYSPQDLREMIMRAHGPRGAGWLARSRKRSLHKTGAFAVVVPLGVKAPLWFRLALASFRESKSWQVLEMRESATVSTRYVFNWRRWRQRERSPFKNLA